MHAPDIDITISGFAPGLASFRAFPTSPITAPVSEFPLARPELPRRGLREYLRAGRKECERALAMMGHGNRAQRRAKARASVYFEPAFA